MRPRAVLSTSLCEGAVLTLHAGCVQQRGSRGTVQLKILLGTKGQPMFKRKAKKSARFDHSLNPA